MVSFALDDSSSNYGQFLVIILCVIMPLKLHSQTMIAAGYHCKVVISHIVILITCSFQVKAGQGQAVDWCGLTRVHVSCFYSASA